MIEKPWENGILTLTENRHCFTNGNKPIFLLGDTAWTLFQRLDLKDSYRYLKNRKVKGYNIVQTVLINFQSKGKNSSFNDLLEQDVSECIKLENKAFWTHIKAVVTMAEELGIYLAILPVWGSVAKANKLNCDNVSEYVDFLAKEFSQFPNIIWVLGGDIRGDAHFEMWDKMGNLLKEKMPNTLIGYHPFGCTSSSYWFQDCNWLDFHMFQSGHRRSDQKNLNAWDETTSKEPWFGEENWKYVRQDYNKTPIRPIMDGEPSYEQIPQGLHDSKQPYWQAHHVRRYAYWAVLAGAAGHMYGHNSIMQFFGMGGSPAYGVKEGWDISLHDTGSDDMKILKNILEEIDFSNCKPMPEILNNYDINNQNDTTIAFGNQNQILVYSYSGKPFSIKKVAGEFECYWVNPVSGIKSYIGDVSFDGIVNIVPPNKKSDQNDWLLYLLKK